MQYDIVQFRKAGLQEFLGTTPEISRWLADQGVTKCDPESAQGQRQMVRLTELARAKGWSVQPLPSPDPPRKEPRVTAQWRSL